MVTPPSPSAPASCLWDVLSNYLFPGETTFLPPLLPRGGASGPLATPIPCMDNPLPQLLASVKGVQLGPCRAASLPRAVPHPGLSLDAPMCTSRGPQNISLPSASGTTSECRGVSGPGWGCRCGQDTPWVLLQGDCRPGRGPRAQSERQVVRKMVPV